MESIARREDEPEKNGSGERRPWAVACLLAAACHGSTDPPAPTRAAYGDVQLGPAKPPPRLRIARLSGPPLVDLPPLAEHEAPARAPPDATPAAHPCRSVWTGWYAAPLSCARALLFGAPHGGGAVPIVPRARLARDPKVLPPVSDHRLDGTEGIVRDQANAPACTAFATATALDHALIRWSGRRESVSVMQIWSRYHSPEVDKSLLSNVGLPLGTEPLWPFNSSEAVSWIPCAEFEKPPRGGCGRPVDEARLQALASKAVGEFTEVEYLDMPPDMTTLRTKLAAGQDLIVALEVPTTFVPKGKAGARYIPQYEASAGPDAGHALVLAGYARLPHGTYFLAHNSWGTGWGDGGYAWIHETTLARWARQVVAVDAEPLEREVDRRPRRRRATTRCPAGLVPDSIAGSCTPACPDGSPRHDGVCAIAGQCPPDYVNLTGACVLAAPITSGTDRATGVSWTCGPGGCRYALPKPIDPSCEGDVCEASCPAPDFHIARMGDAIVCIE